MATYMIDHIFHSTDNTQKLINYSLTKPTFIIYREQDSSLKQKVWL